MDALSNKWIIYDGNCGLCLNSKRLLTRLQIIPENKCLNYHLLEPGLSEKIDLSRFRYEMALVDEQSDGTLYGLEGILQIFGQKVGLLKRIGPGSVIFRMLDYVYHAISYNRYFIFPRRSRFACDCEPAFSMKYFVRWIVLGLLIASVVSALFGAAMAPVFDKAPLVMAAQMLVIVGTGWASQLLLSALLLSREKVYDYWRHLVLIMVVGVLILIPCLLLCWLPVMPLSIVAMVSVLSSSLVMSRMHFQRVRYLGLSQGWTLLWFLGLQAAAVFFSIHFQILAL
jgi:predicted DCC family thiol-disulfide oxidoreductase YuxK